MTVEPIASTPEVTAKVVEGALRAVARFGLTKLTVDDVARSGPRLCRLRGPLEAGRTGEWLARIVLSSGLAPTPEPAETAVLSVVREFVIPAAEERAGTAGGSPDGTAA